MRPAPLTHRAPPFCSRRTTTTGPHPRHGERGPVVLRSVGSVGPGQTVQQGARPGILPLVDNRNNGDLKVTVREIGVTGLLDDVSPNVSVGYRTLVGVVPSVGYFQWLDRVGAAVVGDLVEGPGLAGADCVSGVDGTELDGLEVGVLDSVDSGARFLFPPRLVGLFCWCENTPGSLADAGPGGVFSITLRGCLELIRGPRGRRGYRSLLRHKSHTLGVDSITRRSSTVDASPKVGARRKRGWNTNGQ